jgi:hypothetical protein
VKRKTVVRNAALLSALLLLAGVLVPLAHADGIQTTAVLSTGSHQVTIDSLDFMDLGGGHWRYQTAGAFGGDTMVVDSFVCNPPMGFPPMIIMLWGALDASPFTQVVPSVVPDTWYIIPSAPQEARVWFHWQFVTGVYEHSRPGLARAGLTVSPSIVRTGTTVRAERVAGTNCAFVIFDAAGNRVRTLRTQTSAGAASATWTGEDDFGRRLPEGIYYCCLGDAANSSVCKLILSH